MSYVLFMLQKQWCRHTTAHTYQWHACSITPLRWNRFWWVRIWCQNLENISRYATRVRVVVKAGDLSLMCILIFSAKGLTLLWLRAVGQTVMSSDKALYLAGHTVRWYENVWGDGNKAWRRVRWHCWMEFHNPSKGKEGRGRKKRWCCWDNKTYITISSWAALFLLYLGKG